MVKPKPSLLLQLLRIAHGQANPRRWGKPKQQSPRCFLAQVAPPDGNMKQNAS
jgi:hypothetical protein